MRKKRGVGLGTVLVVVALVVTLGFALAGASVQHLNVQSRLTNSARALDLARSAVNLGLERVLTTPDYGADPSADTLQVFTDSQGDKGQLTFNPTQASQANIPYSLNNLTGTEVKAGSTGQLVPLKTVHLVAVGTCRNVTRTVEVVLSLPPYPYAAASDGPINARDVIVGALPPGSPDGMPQGKLKPANLLSNASGPQSLVLGERSTVSGDLLAKGNISVDQSAKVKGLVRPNQEERELPQWHTEDYDPKVLERPYLELEANYNGSSGPVKFTGTMRRQGNLNIDGDLDVEGALIFVDGDLNVNGALTGKGVVVSSGNLTVRDHAEVDAHDKVALLAKKKLTLKGEGLSSSLITGILYSEGGFEAQQLTLRGVVISRQGSSGDRPVTLRSTKVVKDPTSVTVSVSPTVREGSFSVILRGAGGPKPDAGGISPQPPNLPSYGGIPLLDNSDLLVGDFSVVPGPDGEPLYSVSLRPSGPVIRPNQTAPDIALSISRATGIAYSTIASKIAAASTSSGASATTVGPGFSLTVQEPSQLLPFYQQARVVLWKED